MTFENLLFAYFKARKGKRQRDEVAHFTLNLERELLNLKRRAKPYPLLIKPHELARDDIRKNGHPKKPK